MNTITRFILSLFLGIYFISNTQLQAQVKIGDNSTSINPYSLLELESTDKAFLFPRMTAAQRDAAFDITQAPVGLAIFNTTSSQLEVLHSRFTATGKEVSEWISTGNTNVDTGSKPPSAPQNGQLFFDTANNQFMIFDGNQWNMLQTFAAGTDSENYQMLTLTDEGELKLGKASIDLKAWLEAEGAFRTSGDNQKLSLQGNILQLENGGNVDLSTIIAPTANQLLQLGNTTSQTSALNLTNGGSVSLQASGSLQFATQNGNLVFSVPQQAMGGTGSQTLSVASGTPTSTSVLTLTGGSSVTLQAGNNITLSDTNNTITIGVLTSTLSNADWVANTASSSWELQFESDGSTVRTAAFNIYDSGALAVGQGAIASGNQAIALGNNNTASGNDSTVNGGSNNLATGDYSTVSGGRNNFAYSFGEWVGGLYSTTYSPASTSGWNANDRIFTVGNGQSTGSRSNALTILKNGNTGLGTSTPSATLHVSGTLRLEDGNQATGFVLTSDANGNATWQAAAGGTDSQTFNFGTSTSTGTTLNLVGGNAISLQASGGLTFNRTDSSTLVLEVPATTTPTSIVDSDGDTQIQVEETNDEDIIRFDTAGSERFQISATGEMLFANPGSYGGGNPPNVNSAVLGIEGATHGRLRLTAGSQDSRDPSQGASIDLHGISANAKAGDLDLVAGSNASNQGGAIRFFAGSGERGTWSATGSLTLHSNATLIYNQIEGSSSHAAGNVLTSDASGAARWSTPRTNVTAFHTLTSNTTLVATTHHTVLVQPSSTATITITLPPTANAGTGTYFNIKMMRSGGATGNVVINTNGGETIDGINSRALVSDFQKMTIQTDGSNWFVISE